MYALFDKTKVRSWIRKAHKEGCLAYGYGYVTDNLAILKTEPPMYPTVLEMYGTLTPPCRYSAGQFQALMTLPNERIEVIDSRLEYAPDPKFRLRIFYDPETGRKLTVNCLYFNFLKDTKECTFWTNDEMTRLWIVCDNEIIALIAPYRLQNQLSHVSFKVEKVEEEREQD